MFDANSSADAAVDNGIASPDEPLDVRSILLQSDLPTVVATAAIAFTQERVIDDAEFRRLTAGLDDLDKDAGIAAKLSLRREVLMRYKGISLLCAVIRLPGISYTIEIDPISRSVAHWEWQEG